MNSAKLGMTKGVAVAGDSAGGNLAAVSALMCRDRGIELKAQVLVFPFIAFDVVSRSAIEYSNFLSLTRKQAFWFNAQYTSGPQDHANPKFSPILWGKFEGLPPALIMTAEYDALRDQGEAYADTLAEAGVDVTSVRVRGVTHGFIGLPEIGGDAFAMMGGYLKRRFRPS
jgi:acetyl esterase